MSARQGALRHSLVGQITINRGKTLKGGAAIAEMAGGSYADVPDMVVHSRRRAHGHALQLWFEGHHVETRRHVKVSGWERDFNEDLKISPSLGWFDENECARQIAEVV